VPRLREAGALNKWAAFRVLEEIPRQPNEFASPPSVPSANLKPGIGESGSSISKLRSTSGLYSPHTSPSSYRRTRSGRGINPPPTPPPVRADQTSAFRPSPSVYTLDGERKREAKRGGCEEGSESRGHNAALLRQGAVTVGVWKFPPWKNITFLLGGPNKCNSVTARSLSRLSSGSMSPRLSFTRQVVIKIAPRAPAYLTKSDFSEIPRIGIPYVCANRYDTFFFNTWKNCIAELDRQTSS